MLPRHPHSIFRPPTYRIRLEVEREPGNRLPNHDTPSRLRSSHGAQDVVRLCDIAHVQEFVAKQSPEAIAKIGYLEVCLRDPYAHTDHDTYWPPGFRQQALVSLQQLLQGCPDLVELRLLDVDDFAEIFDPLEKMTKTYFGAYHSLKVLTIVSGPGTDWAQYQSFCVYAVESLKKLRALTLGSPRYRQRFATGLDQTLTRILHTRSLQHLSLWDSVATPDIWRKVHVSSRCQLETLHISARKDILPEEATEIIAKVGSTVKYLSLNAFTYSQLRFVPSKLQTLHLGPSLSSCDVSEALEYFSMVPTIRTIEIARYIDSKKDLDDLLEIVQGSLQSRRYPGLEKIKLTAASSKDIPTSSIEARRRPGLRKATTADFDPLIQVLRNGIDGLWKAVDRDIRQAGRSGLDHPSVAGMERCDIATLYHLNIAPFSRMIPK